MMPRSAKILLTPRQIKVIDLLIYKGFSQVDAAKEVGAHESTVSKWMNSDNKFISAYDEELIKAKNLRVRRFRSKALRATDRLFELMENADKDSVCLDAVKTILQKADEVEFASGGHEVNIIDDL